MIWNIFPNSDEESAEAKSCTHKDLTLWSWITDKILPHLCPMDNYSPWSSIVYEIKLKCFSSAQMPFCHQFWGLSSQGSPKWICNSDKTSLFHIPWMYCTYFYPFTSSSVSPCHICSLCLESLLFQFASYKASKAPQQPYIHEEAFPDFCSPIAYFL